MVFLGTCWISIKEVKPSFVLVVEDGIALEVMQGNLHHLTLKVESCGFTPVVVANLWFHSSNYGDGSEPLMVSQGWQASFLIAKDTLGFFSSCGMGIRVHLELRGKFQLPSPVGTGILQFV